MKLDVRCFVQRTRNLPSLPSVYYELERAVCQPDSSINDITDIIRNDQSLALRLLKIANSAFYGSPPEIGTLEEAVMLIGFREIQELALATAVIEAFQKVSSRLVNVVSFWEHSIACGLASALIAECGHDPMPERFFVGGLLHDIGRLIMLLNAPEESQAILDRCEAEGRMNSELEREVFGFDHALLGAELISFWKLPASVANMVSCHHDPSKAVTVLFDAFVVHYADFITSALEFGNSGEFYVCPLLIPAPCKTYLIEEEQMELLLDDLETQCRDVFLIFGGTGEGSRTRKGEATR